MDKRTRLRRAVCCGTKITKGCFGPMGGSKSVHHFFGPDKYYCQTMSLQTRVIGSRLESVFEALLTRWVSLMYS